MELIVLREISLSSELNGQNPMLWRYMDFKKLKDLLQFNSLYFASPYQFDDKFEGFPKKLKNVDAEGAIVDKDQALRILAGNRQSVKINCWHINEYESDGMWKLYSKPEGIAIKSSLNRIQNSFLTHEKGDNKLYVEKIIYEDKPAPLTHGYDIHKIFA
jgi:hypothetical protein